MWRFWLIPLVLAVLVVGPFLIWGDDLVAIFAPGSAGGALDAGGSRVWLVAVGLLVADLFIPIPTTSVVAALGIVYGPVVGAAIGVAGTSLAASIGYGIGRFLGRPIAARFIGDAMAGGERVFRRHGGWIVAGSRWMPVLPEVVSVVAGVSRMRFTAFILSALCGVVPFCAVFATVGHLGAERPVLTLTLSALAPLMLWWIVRRVRGVVGAGGPR